MARCYVPHFYVLLIRGRHAVIAIAGTCLRSQMRTEVAGYVGSYGGQTPPAVVLPMPFHQNNAVSLVKYTSQDQR